MTDLAHPKLRAWEAHKSKAFVAHQLKNKLYLNESVARMEAVGAHTLHQLQAKLYDAGYECYMIHHGIAFNGMWDPANDQHGKKMPELVLVPFSGPLWNDWFELCLHAWDVSEIWCWNDFLAVPRQPSVQRALHATFPGGVQQFPSCNLAR